MNPRDLETVRSAGFPYPEDLIQLFVGGSELHGAKLAGTDDHDIYGVYIEPPAVALGLDSDEHFVWSTASQHARNTPLGVDVTLYSLRKWARLACKGNPTCLHFLFVGHDPVTSWTSIVARREVFLSRMCLKQFLGFAEDQLKRLTGEKGRGKKGQRPELEVSHGYDTKAGFHTIRLLHECKELMETGRITLPRPEKELLIDIRRGAWSMDRLIREANALFLACTEAEKTSPLRPTVDRHAVSKLIAETYQDHWSRAKGRVKAS